MTNKFLTLLAATGLIAACATVANDPAGPPMAGDMTPEERGAYVTVAAASDLYEIQSGQMAAQRARRTQVREFGQMLVSHHSQTTQTLTAAARASGLNPPPPTLLPMQQEMIERLQQTPDSNFDRVFLRQQVQAHQMALRLHRNYARRGDTPQLRTAAASAVPIIQQHLRQSQRLSR